MKHSLARIATRTLPFLLALVPLVSRADSFAAGADSNGNFFFGMCLGNCSVGGGITGLAGTILGLINGVAIPLIFAVAFVMFLWGVFTYFIAGGANDEKRKEGRQFILYAIIGFVLMISMWGIVNAIVSTFGFGGDTHPPLPTF